MNIFINITYQIYSLHINDSTLPKQLVSKCTMLTTVDNMDNGKVTVVTLLDLSAAFDTIYHLILLQRLHRHFGISGSTLRWFKSYFQTDMKALTNLAHYLAHNTFYSEFRKDPSLALFCLAYILRLSAKLLLIIICLLMKHRFTYHFHNQMHKNKIMFRL